MSDRKIVFHMRGEFNPACFRLGKYDAIGLIDTEINQDVEVYFALKEKHNYLMEYQSLFINRIYRCIQQVRFPRVDVVLCPETSHSLLTTFLSCYLTSHSYRPPNGTHTIKKRTLAEMRALSLEMKMSKEERISQQRCFDTMQDSFQIHKIKTNQRKRYEGLMFDDTDFPNVMGKRVLIIDDSIFSGATVKALADMAMDRYANEIQILTLFWCGSMRDKNET
jgi:hypothetical protein